MIRVALFTLIFLCGIPAVASLYQPEESSSVAVRPDGVAEPLAFDEFQSRMVTLANVADPRPNTEGQPNRDRKKVLDRVKAFQQVAKPTSDELAAHAVDLLRLGNTDPRPGDPGLYLDKAINLLAPHSRDRNLNYFLLTTLAQIHLARGEGREAVNVYENALLDTTLPATVKGWTEPQRNWIKKLDEEYVLHYLELRLAEREHPSTPDREEPLPLFPLPVKNKATEPVRFVNDAGQYEAGVLAAAERSKLPPDAVAIVQQMLLWFPTDTRLHWLLAELYTVEGKLDEANTLFDQCTWSKQYGNRRVLMEHRAAVKVALKAKRDAEEQARLDAYPINLKAVWYYFAGVVAIAVFALVRSRRKRGGWPCCGGS